MDASMPAYPADVLARAHRIRLVGFDVDGTLTDGRLLYGTDGHEAKSFHVQDGMGLTLLRHAGIELAAIVGIGTGPGGDDADAQRLRCGCQHSPRGGQATQ